jgi:hypothetical protein
VIGHSQSKTARISVVSAGLTIVCPWSKCAWNSGKAFSKSHRRNELLESLLESGYYDYRAFTVSPITGFIVLVVVLVSNGLLGLAAYWIVIHK